MYRHTQGDKTKIILEQKQGNKRPNKPHKKRMDYSNIPLALIFFFLKITSTVNINNSLLNSEMRSNETLENMNH